MARIVDALNGLQKASTPQNLITIDLVDLSRQALTRWEEAAEQNSVMLTAEFQKEPLFAQLDPDHITQVFDALFSNAIRFSSGAKVTLRAETGNSGMVLVMIEDSGPGIDLENQAKIFHPFFQVDTTSMYPHDGLGIGLSLAKDIIKSHGGEMWVKSEPGSGSVFHFTLPPSKN